MTVFAIFFWVCLTYYLILLFYYLVFGIVGFFESNKRNHESREENYEAIMSSSFTLPVSIIIPAHNEELWVRDTVLSVLRLDYPQFELIVVDDESTDRTLDILKELLDLQYVNNVYSDQFNSGKILGFLKSRKYPHVSVLSKKSGQKKAGALNAALNLAKYKYVCVMDCDTILERDALLKVMAHVQKDPEHVVGIGSFFGLANGFRIENGVVLEKRFIAVPLIAYQNLEYIRSFIGNRIGWSRQNAMPIISGGFGVWRRDIVLAAGAFDPWYSSEDLEFTFPAHDYLIRNGKRDYRITMLPHYVGWTEGPHTISQLIKQQNRWQRVTNEAVWRYRHMLFNPKYGRLGCVSLPYFVFYEVLGVFFEIGSVLVTVFGCLIGMIAWRMLLNFLMMMLLCQSLTSLIPLFILNRDYRLLKVREVAYFVILSFFEFFWYRWIIVWAKVEGFIQFFCGKRTMDSIQRHRT